MTRFLCGLLPTQRQFAAVYLVKHRGRPFPGRAVVLGNRAVDEYDRTWAKLSTLLFWLENPVLWVRVRWLYWRSGV